jgi:hypothetical protein
MVRAWAFVRFGAGAGSVGRRLRRSGDPELDDEDTGRYPGAGAAFAFG